MDAEFAGLIGAGIGFAFGWFQYEIMSRFVIGGLHRTNRSKNAAENADYLRRIRLLQVAMLLLMLVGVPVLGYVVGRSAFGWVV